MARTKGSKDSIKRKRKKKRKNKFSPNYKAYKPKIIDRDVLKLYIWTIENMSKSGLHNWGISQRSKAKPVIFKPFLRIDIDVNEFKNKQQIAEWSIRNIGKQGRFQIRAWGHARNKYHCSARTIATVELIESPEGLKAYVTPHTRLKRYRWFYND